MRSWVRWRNYYYPVIVLALDTGARTGSCAIASGEEIREETAEGMPSHEARLPGALMRILEHSGLALDDVDAFAVSTGPGSFTGTRVGIATMQALAFATGRPLVGVSAFDALAATADWQRRERRSDSSARPVATWIDAWRGEIFAALYSGRQQIEPPSVEHAAAVLDRIRHRGALFIGDAVAPHADLIRRQGDAAALAEPVAPLLAGAIARLAVQLVASGHRPSPDAIVPLYVRRTDAEIARDARSTR
jgi:tRNA threonylcarbamoyladenosine biosynthesis protein TsaB